MLNPNFCIGNTIFCILNAKFSQSEFYTSDTIFCIWNQKASSGHFLYVRYKIYFACRNDILTMLHSKFACIIPFFLKKKYFFEYGINVWKMNWAKITNPQIRPIVETDLLQNMNVLDSWIMFSLRILENCLFDRRESDKTLIFFRRGNHHWFDKLSYKIFHKRKEIVSRFFMG